MRISRLYISFLLILFYTIVNHTQQISFSSLGGPYGGNLGDVISTSAGELFVSSYYSEGKGIYKSVDNGLSWELLPPIYSYNEFFALGIDQNNIIFAGTSGGGLYRSTDIGDNWTWLNSYPSPECWVITFNKNGDVFAGDGDWGGLYKSTDVGNNWSQLLPSTITVLSIEIDFGGTIYIGASNDFLKSTDDGLTWNSYYSGLPGTEIATVITNQVGEIFVGTGYISQGNGVYSSPDGGVNWFQRGLLGQTVYSLIIDNNGILYAGTKDNGVYRSMDDGLSWEQINHGLINLNIFRVKMIPNDILFACSESGGGIYRSTDIGESWEITGVGAGTLNRAIICETGDIYAASFNGVQKFNSVANKWSILGLTVTSSVPGWNWISDIVKDNDGIFFASSWAGSVYSSVDGGITWDSLAPISSTQTYITSMAIYPDNSLLLGTTSEYIKRSTDRGKTWLTIINDLPNSHTSNISVTDEGMIYVISGNNLCKANQLNSLFNVVNDTIIPVSPPFLNQIAVGSEGSIFFFNRIEQHGIYRSLDYGESWLKISEAIVNSISLSNNKYIVAGLPSGQGVMISSDLGNTWSTITAGIPNNAYIIWNQIDSEGYLYASAGELGLFKSNSIVVGVNEQTISSASTFELHQNYPNPFNSSTNIRYTISQPGRVTLKVYDVMGREISVLLDRNQESGSYDLIFQSKDLASGIYFYTITSGNFMATKKLILLK